MYVHQALPKDINSFKNPSYQIKKKSSPKQKLTTSRMHNQPSEQASIKHSSSQKAHLHHITSKQKPHLSSIEKNEGKQIVLSKQIYSICHKRNQQILNKPEKFRESSIQKQKILRNPQPTKEIVICRMENKVIKTIQLPFHYFDLSEIDGAFWHIYQGQSKNNGIRHGFGAQRFVNGEKFIGNFIQNKANGQGTYYSLRKKIMGQWQNNKLKQVYLQL